MVRSRFFPAAECRAWSHALLFVFLLGIRSSSTSTRSSLPAAADDDAFTFIEHGRSFVEYLQQPPPAANSKSEVDHVVTVELDFRTLVGNAPLLHRDPRRRLDDDVIDSSPEVAETARRRVTGCAREAEIRVQLKIGMLHVSVTYDEEHVVCVSVGQGKCQRASITFSAIRYHAIIKFRH